MKELYTHGADAFLCRLYIFMLTWLRLVEGGVFIFMISEQVFSDDVDTFDFYAWFLHVVGILFYLRPYNNLIWGKGSVSLACVKESGTQFNIRESITRLIFWKVYKISPSCVRAEGFQFWNSSVLYNALASLKGLIFRFRVPAFIKS